ncbi:MAG TPA: DUF4347 domain-containing protein, partial [Oscillatoriaceae cyanobacterium M33_DOE_052]|nr:DUF4347 domain-containing protein [Oscillatoriaceae cyanobacterium M33_DOE_052]
MPASIIFVDSSVENYQTLLQGADPNAQVVVLDTERSGIAQITETLALRQDITAVHLLSHGSVGNLHLGRDILNTDNLAKFSPQIKQWGASLTENADILLYGCDVAAGVTGANFIQNLSSLTSADIAASNDLTGNPDLGGDWELEITTGAIEADIPLAEEATESYEYVLANYNVTVATDDGTGGTANTLSWAILQANNSVGVDDTITLNTDVTVNGVMLTLVNSNIDFIGNNHIVSGGNSFRPFFVKSGMVNFSDMTITQGKAQGGNSVGWGGSGAGMGGGLFIYDGTVTVNNLIFDQNLAQGGLVQGGSGGWGAGGGMFGSSAYNAFGGGGGLFASATGSTGAYGGNGNYGGGPGAFGGGGNHAYSALPGGFGGGGGSTPYGGGRGGNGGFGGGGGRGPQGWGLGGYGGGGSIGGFGGGNGASNGAGMGGAIFIRQGSLTLNNTILSNNTATAGGTGALGLGGAIFSMQSLTNTNGNNQGMPTTLPTVNFTGYLRTSGNTAADNAGTNTNNNDLYWTNTNTSPTLTDTAVTLNSVLEDTGAPTGAVGTLVSQIVTLGGNVIDPDTSPLTGIALTAADTTNGSWFYTTDGGTTWNPLGSVSSTSARLLAADANTRIYFQPTTADYNGTVTNAITFHAWDQIARTNGATADTTINIGISTASDTADITVTAVNDQPSFTTTGNPATVNEDAGAITISNWATFNPGPANEASQTATYIISNIGNPGLFATAPTVDSSGTLTYTPATNANGTSTFDVVVQDNGGTTNGGGDTSASQTFTITVNPINDAPSFSNAGNQTLPSWTNTVQTVSGWANTFIVGPTADENTQTVSDFLVSVTSGNTLFTTLPDIANNGTLTYTPNGTPGTATVQVQLKDDGGTLNGGIDTSAAATFTITIPPPTVNLLVNTTTGTEAGTTAITLTATAQGAVFGNQTLNLALTGTASNADFSGTIPAQITIADGSNSGQVTLTVANDLIDEDSETATLTISNPSVGIALGTTTAQTITITDDDTAGYDITAISGDTSEFGGQATFDIHLTSEPTATVTLNFASSDTTEGTVIPSVAFDNTNWNIPQTITITGVDDLVADGDITYNITGTAISADTKYNNNNPANVAVVNTDNDSPGVTITQTGGNTELTEGSITDSYTIQLNTLPIGNVQITATADAQTEIRLDGVNFAASQPLTFTPTNGMTAQTVTVRAIDDTNPEDYHSGGITHTISNSADTNYPTTMTVGGVNTQITDNDISYTLTGSSTTVTEGNSGSQQITYNITRNGAISASSTGDFSFTGTAANTIDYNLISITGTGVTTSGSTITFAANSTSATMTVEVLGDQIDEDSETLQINLVNPTATGTPSLIGSPVTTTITDDDTAGITVTPTAGLTTTETGVTSSFAVQLNSQPTANVTINLSSDKPAEGTIDKNSLTFTAANWNTPQTVTITGVDDLVDDGDIAYNIITAAATSTDAKYSGMDAADVAVTNINNDTAGITITPTSGLTTTEAGGTATFTVKLNSQPTANVSINLNSDKPTEGTIDKN